MKFFKGKDEPLSEPILEQLRERMTLSAAPTAVKDVLMRELDLLERIGPATSEFSIGLTYVEYLLSLPWASRTEDILDLDLAEHILEEEHYGLHDIKERILEHLAVRKLKMQRRASILVVDNEEIVRKNLSFVLEKAGYSVQTAGDGGAALSLCSLDEFDVVLTDIRMGAFDGIELLERVKRVSPSSQVILMTGFATVGSAVDAMRRGAFHYITKPFDLDDVTRTVRQAVEKRALRLDTRGSVLCFSGPPGTGKTSLGRSIARALGRRFVRISLGGIKDESEIRGHRKTYAGAMPGRIIDEMKKAGVCNPVIVLDELDKVGSDVKGDPAAALLEALDPEQNTHFVDHYLDVPFDLSSVMFIVTANVIENIPPPLRDRLEVIAFSGYTEDEKLKIAEQYLVPRQIRENGLSGKAPVFLPAALLKIVQEYTQEAGIRDLNRRISTICRKIAHNIVRDANESGLLRITPEKVEKLLGPRKYQLEIADGKDRVGVVAGLVWTEVGGDVIFIEALKMPGQQQLILTGSLGNVMKESAQAALSFVRSNSGKFGIAADFFDRNDIHVHIPAGAVPKDGPSAGSTIALALISLLTGRPARRDVAISGEMTLSGRILPVGGIKEKILAARRSGFRDVVLPRNNKVDIENLASGVVRDLTIHFVSEIEGAVDAVLGSVSPPLPQE